MGFPALFIHQPDQPHFRISETRFGLTVDDAFGEIEGFSIIWQDRNTIGGGVLLYVRNNLKAYLNLPLHKLTSLLSLNISFARYGRETHRQFLLQYYTDLLTYRLDLTRISQPIKILLLQLQPRDNHGRLVHRHV